MPHSLQIDSYAFFTRQFHGWDKIRVTRYECDCVRNPFRGEPSDVQPNPHINTFLLEVGYQIVSCDRTRSSRYGGKRSVSQLPALKGNYSSSHSEIGLQFQVT